MRFEISYDETVWAIMPEPDAEADGLWVAEQRLRFAGGPFSADLDAFESAAREALRRRREGGVTSLFFRPDAVPVTGVLHVGLLETRVADSGEPLAWLPPGVTPRIDPAVTTFATPHVASGHRIAYVSDRDGADGAPLTGLVYGLPLGDLTGYVISEQAHSDVTGLMQAHADRIVGSLRLVA
ncbi:hypothetical protein [Agromyces marinus]|uniref:Uncharacterized protein n=1 Tax=Agromyces marinus TaxID=1389020 RepID=A0ABM8H3Y2_9MICO|nr:hypothetical protein [Agromyces marinus]UIP59460.1 hypothetical protein DSM26151_23670 [Agromyces marinus]BDZ55495.1 hypothetical protein GCM10025870_25680 [Agromyces marinus]